jgi:hypothetical protein
MAGNQEFVSAAFPFQNLVTAHDAILHFVDAHQPTKLVGLVRFPFANHFGVRFEQTQHFAFHVAVSTPHPFLGLRDHFSPPKEESAQGSLLG